MIKFFRKIRYNLINQNKTTQYVKYAIGEILLVVIGILIALQINTWNEKNKERIKEREILGDLVENLELNIKILEDNIKELKLYDKSSEYVLASLYDKRPFNDSIKVHFHLARVPKIAMNLSYSGYEGYKNIGFYIITNKVLKNEILSLFETVYPNTLASFEPVNADFPEFDNHVVQNFIFTNGSLDPIDYQSLFTDHYYISWIRAYKEGRKEVINMEADLLLKTERVLDLVNNELNTSISGS